MRCPAEIDITFDPVADEIEKVTITQPGLTKYQVVEGDAPTPHQLIKIADWAWEEFAFTNDETDHRLYCVSGQDADDLTTHEMYVSSSNAETAAAKASLLHQQDSGHILVNTTAVLHES